MDKEERFSWIIFFLIILIPHSLLIAFLVIGDNNKNIFGITSFKDLLESFYYCATFIAVFYAVKAYDSWKRQLKGTERFKTEKKIIKEIHKIKRKSCKLALDASRLGHDLEAYIKRKTPYKDLNSEVQSKFSAVAEHATNLINYSATFNQKVKDLFDKKHPTSLPPEEIIQSINELTNHTIELSRDIHNIFDHFNNSIPPAPLNKKQSEQIKERFKAETTRIESSQQKTIKIIKNSYK